MNKLKWTRFLLATITLHGWMLYAETAKDPDVSVTLYYFHRTNRCPSCLNMEAWTRKIAETSSGALTMESINLDLPEHQHFMKEFDLEFGTLVIAERIDEVVLRWKRLDDIWNHSESETGYTTYVTNALAQEGFAAKGGSK